MLFWKDMLVFDLRRSRSGRLDVKLIKMFYMRGAGWGNSDEKIIQAAFKPKTNYILI